MKASTGGDLEASPLSRFLCFSLYSANQAMNRVYNTVLNEFGLTYTQYLVLVLLWNQDDQMVGELGRNLFLESNTLTPLLKRLEAMDFVERVRDADDERQVRVRLTRRGKKLEGQVACVPEKIMQASGLNIHTVEDLNNKIIYLRQGLTDWRDSQ